jgi:hypothetical protein
MTMHRATFCCLVAAALVGCSGEFEDKDDSTDDGGSDGSDGGDGGSGDGGSDGSDGGDGGSDGGDYDLPSLTSDIGALEGCYGYDGVDVTGATAYFYGEYFPNSEGGWSGTERWILFANEAWQDAGNDDCEVVWLVSAVEGSPGACGACSVGLEVSASIDASRTTCPPQLWEDPADQQWTSAYGVAATGSTSTWYYAASGTYLGAGGVDGDALNYITEATCQFF